jgi:hypothetical protein
MSHVSYAVLLSIALFAGMFVMLELGHRLAERVEQRDPGAHRGTGPVEGAVFALLGLLVAFSFSGAAARFDARRQLVVEEANAIGTAYLRIDALPAAEQPAMRDRFRRYLDARLAAYRSLPDVDAAREQLAAADAVQAEIWARSVAACPSAGGSPCAILVLPALNAMFDVAAARTAAARMHPPAVTFWLLAGLGIGCALLAGYSMADGKRRKWTHIVGFAVVTAVTFYVILDLEYPRLGLIRVDAFDQVLVDVRASMERGS